MPDHFKFVTYSFFLSLSYLTDIDDIDVRFAYWILFI